MFKICLSVLCVFLVTRTATAQTPKAEDTLRLKSPEVIVTGFPATPDRAIAPTETISRPVIRALATEQDAAKIGALTTSASYYSESGLDIGYTHLSLRGIDQRRLSVMVNGIPQNGPEDQEVYWVDMPGLLSNASAIDIQRGAGNAYYGPPAIGGSINVHTDPSPIRSLVASAGFGSYNTSTYALQGSTGLLYDKYIVAGRVARTHTDGYRHEAWMDRTPYFFSIARYDSVMMTQFNAYGGPFDDGLSYYGIDKPSLNGPDSVRRYNPSETFTYERRPEEGEHFTQPHYEALNEWRIGPATTLWNTLFLIQGGGYFDIDGTWPSSYYGISNAEYYQLTPVYAARYGFTPIVDDTNFTEQIYRGFIANRQWGWLPRLEWKHDGGTLSVAGELRFHNSEHYGDLTMATQIPADLPKDYHFYDFKVGKDIANVSAFDQLEVAEGLTVSGGLQLVNERYRFYDQKLIYVDSAMSARRQNISTGWTSYDFAVPFQFINPRLGLRAEVSPDLSVFASGSITSREPRFSDYYAADFLTEPNFELDGFGGYDFSRPVVRPELVRDVEVGLDIHTVKLTSKASLAGRINGYYMGFKDEIILSGQLDNFGSPVQLNAASTVHYGLELELEGSMSDLLSLTANAGVSHNEILDIDTFTLGLPSTIIGNQPAGVPTFIANGLLTITPTSWLRLDITGRYNGGLFGDIDNTQEHRLDAYFVSDAILTLRSPEFAGLSYVEAKVQVNNIFDRNYASMSNSSGFFPAAPRHFYGTISIGL
jgi:iron complex outermembrane receptor protein